MENIVAGRGQPGFAAVAVAPDGNRYVADAKNHSIRQVAPDGSVITIAGFGGPGDRDGLGCLATFSKPVGITVDHDGTLYVTERCGHRVRRLKQLRLSNVWYVSTVVCGESGLLRRPRGIVADGNGDLWVADSGHNQIVCLRLRVRGDAYPVLTVGSGRRGHRDGSAHFASFHGPWGLAVDPNNGDIVVTETLGNRVRRITATDGRVSTIAGTGKSGSTDGPGVLAQLDNPAGVAVTGKGAVIVVEMNGGRVRWIDATPSHTVRTVIQRVDPVRLVHPSGCAVDSSGAILVAEIHRLRQLMLCGPDAACATCGDSCGIYACTDCRGVRYCSSECQMDVLKMLERECARDSVEIQARERAREAKREAKHEKKRAAYRAEVQATKQARADAAEEWFKQCEAKHERQRAAYRAEVQAREQARADAAAGEKWVKKLMAEVAAENREKVQRAEDERILERARVDRERLAREKKEHALAAAAVAAAAAVVAAAALPCPRPEAAAFKESLGLHPGFFDSEYDRCYCPHCYPPDFPDTIVEDGPTEYVVPRGWVRFGLKTPPQAAVHEIFDKWSVSFHGVKSVAVLKGVLDIGGLLKPGDRLPDGSLLRSTKCNGEQASGFFTSPTIRYAGLKFYAEPQPWRDDTMRASMALQFRQQPDSVLRKHAETMGFTETWPRHLGIACPHVNLEEIEWESDANQRAIPYGLLVRVWPTGADPDAEVYKAPPPADYHDGGAAMPARKRAADEAAQQDGKRCRGDEW